MKYIYKPKTKYEKFGLSVYKILVENFSSSFFVGGIVRDILLKKIVTDIDIASSATPNEVEKLFVNKNFKIDLSFKNFGVVAIQQKQFTLTISTFRKEKYVGSRFPKVVYVKTPKQDAQRRDFTINSLYLSVESSQILNFFSGLEDINCKQIRFIGKPEQRIQEDPLRIVRAFRFAVKYNLKFEKNTLLAIEKYFILLQKISKNKINSEIEKLSEKRKQKKLISLLDNKKMLDIYFK